MHILIIGYGNERCQDDEEVLRGTIQPWQCKVFGAACTPTTPIGACAAQYGCQPRVGVR